MRCITKDESYTDAIEYLKNNPDGIHDAWNEWHDKPGGSLFLFCSPTGTTSLFGACGCLTQVKRGDAQVVGFKNSKALTAEIRADPHIPTSPEDYDPKTSGGHFAAWQMRFDKLALAEAIERKEADEDSSFKY